MDYSFQDRFNDIFGELHLCCNDHLIVGEIGDRLLLMCYEEVHGNKNSPKPLDEWPILDDIVAVTFN